MLNFRKNLEEMEDKLNAVSESQRQLQGQFKSLEANTERLLPEHLARVQATLAEHKRADNDRLNAQLLDFLARLTDEFKTQSAQVTEELKRQEQRASEGLAQMRREVGAQFDAVRAENAGLQAQLEAFRAQWGQRVAFEIRTESPALLATWCEEMTKRLRAFEVESGMVHLFAAQLFQHFGALRALQNELESGGGAGFEGRMEEFERTLWMPDARISWGDLTPQNSTPEQRQTLRCLETATAELRAHVKETLRRRTGIAALEIVPGETRFDARFHTSSEFLQTPTSDVARHNVIVAVERGGFELISPDGQKKLLQPARVRRAVFQSAAPPPAKVPEAAPPLMRATAPVVAAPNSVVELIAPTEELRAPTTELGAPMEELGAPTQERGAGTVPLAPPMVAPPLSDAPRVTGQL